MNPPAPMCPSRTDLRLSIDDLRAFGVVPSQVQAFKQLLLSAGDGAGALPAASDLLPLQAQAVRQGLLQEGGGARLIVGGVGSGKSTLAKLLFLHGSHSGQRVLLLLASAAARRQARAQLATTLPASELALSVTSPARLLRRLQRQPRLLAEVDCVLVDSLDWLLKERCRRLFAALLRRLRAVGPGLQVVGFVAEDALPAAMAGFAQPLFAEVICGPATQPVPVWQLHGGRLRPCSSLRPGGAADHAGTATAAEPLVPSAEVPSEVLIDRAGPEAPILRASLLALARRGERTLVLLPQHSQRLRLLHNLIAIRPALPAAQQALVELSATAPGHGQDLLRAALSHGLAIDGDELTPAQGWVVRRAQARGEVLLTISQRLGRIPSPGTQVDNIVCWLPTLSKDASAGDRRAIHPSVGDLRRRLIVGGRVLLACDSLAQVERWAATYATASQIPGESFRGSRQRGHLGWPAGLRFLPGPTATASPAAEPLELLTRAALFARHLPLPLLLSEPALGDYLGLLLARAGAAGLAEQPVFRWLARQASRLGHEDLRALKAVLMLDDWLGGLPGPELERRYHVFLGWLLRCARAVASGLGRLGRMDRRHGASHVGLATLIRRLRRIHPDGVAEHGLAPIGRHISTLLGALQAQDAALHLRLGPRQVSRR
jgi:hypothetical protein